MGGDACSSLCRQANQKLAVKSSLRRFYISNKTAIDLALKPVDFVFALIAIPAAYALLLYRTLGSARFPLTTQLLKRIGVFPVRNHYFEPLFDDRILKAPLNTRRLLPGVDLNESGQVDFLGKLCHSQELIDLNLSKESDDLPETFFINNGSFEAGDADFLFQFIRHIKPNKLVEIGSGHSTKLARIAMQRNFDETDRAYEHICIEPYEQDWLEELSGVRVLRSRVEDCNLNWADYLQAGDLLFVDSSHIIRPQGDVLTEYLEIFPSLRPGVLVHVHDIFTPYDYPKSWVVDDVRFWNEQYLLEALLTHSTRYEVVAALNFLKNSHYDALKRVCPYLDKNHEPGSFYFRVLGQA